jgi:hypothetical protein
MGIQGVNRTVAEIAEKRRNQRVRKVCPVSLSMPGDTDNGVRRMVTANVSPGGMLLVSRMDRFPPAGCAVNVRPEADAAQTLPARVVYTRYSPRAEMRFAGVKFEGAVSGADMRWFDLGQPDDDVGIALQRLAEIEPKPAARAADPARKPVREAPPPSRLKPVGTTPERTQEPAGATQRAAILEAMTEFCTAWGEAKIKEVIVARHVLSRAKGVEGMRALKRSWLIASEDIPRTLDALFTIRDGLSRSSDDRYDNPYYDEERDQGGPPVLQALRASLGAVGRILVEHGYEDLSGSTDWATDLATPTRMRYRGPLRLSDSLRNVLRRAATLHVETRKRESRSQRETRERQIEDVLGWWDQT